MRRGRAKKAKRIVIKELNFTGDEPLSEGEGGLTFRDILILRARKAQEYAEVINELREMEAPEYTLAPLEHNIAMMVRTPILTGREFAREEGRFFEALADAMAAYDRGERRSQIDFSIDPRETKECSCVTMTIREKRPLGWKCAIHGWVTSSVES
jgi:hypothetical protein